MSEPGTVQKKSIVAHFDDENITKVVLDEDERLIVTVEKNGKEKSMGFLTDGSISLPVAKIHVKNDSSSNTTYQFGTITDYGIWIASETFNAGTEGDVNFLYEYDADGEFYWIGAVGSVSMHYEFIPDDCVNCYLEDSTKAIIIDPTVNAAATIHCWD